MATHAIDVDRLKALGALSDEDLGETEEDVKVRFIVPLLEALGHTRLRFEHKGMDIVLKDGLPRGHAVVVEAKRPSVSLDQHLEQLERYSFEERALVAVITNGVVLRVYAPFWNKAKSFAETILWAFQRADLKQQRHYEALAALLCHEALASTKVRAALEHRQATVELIWEMAEEFRQQHREWSKRVAERLVEIERQILQLEEERCQREQEFREIGPHARDKIRRLFKLGLVPLVPTGEFADMATDGATPVAAPTVRRKRGRPTPGEWTEEELWRKTTPHQRAIFAAFVAAGRRTLGLKEIAERAGIRPNAASAATRPYRTRRAISGREPLIEFQKVSGKERQLRGNLYTIAARYWPLIKRLYRDHAPPRKKPRKKTDRK